MRAIIYARKSTDNDKDQQQSLDIQLDWATKFVESRSDVSVVETILEAKSAFKIDWRDGFLKLVEHFEKWNADTLIVYQIDRICRNPLDEWNIKWLTQQGKIKRIFSSQWEFDWRQILTLSLFMAMANQYSIDHSYRVSKWMKAKIEKWYTNGGNRLGYYVDKNDNWLSKPDEDAKFIKRIFELKISWWTLQFLTKKLYEEWFRTKKWAKVGKTVIERIIKNPFYYWMVVYKWEYFKWKHDPLISKEIFDKANSFWRGIILVRDAEISPLKWKVYSKETGARLTCSLAKRKYVFFHTHSRKVDEKVYYNQKYIIEHFDANIGLYTIPKEFREIVKDKIYNDIGKDTSEIKKEQTLIRKKISSLENEFEWAKKMRRNEELTAEEFLQDKNRILNEIEDLQNKLINLNRKHWELLENLEKMVELFVNLEQERKKLDTNKKLNIINNIVVELKVDKEKRLHIEEEPLFEAFRMYNCNKWWTQWVTIPRPSP